MRLLVQKESEPITPYIFKVSKSNILGSWKQYVLTIFPYSRFNPSVKTMVFLQSWLWEAAVRFKLVKTDRASIDKFNFCYFLGDYCHVADCCIMMENYQAL
jgi:hypothetical protein